MKLLETVPLSLTVRRFCFVAATETLCLESRVAHHELFHLRVVEPQPATTCGWSRRLQVGGVFFLNLWLLWDDGRVQLTAQVAEEGERRGLKTCQAR